MMGMVYGSPLPPEENASDPVRKHLGQSERLRGWWHDGTFFKTQNFPVQRFKRQKLLRWQSQGVRGNLWGQCPRVIVKVSGAWSGQGGTCPASSALVTNACTAALQEAWGGGSSRCRQRIGKTGSLRYEQAAA